MSGRVQDFEFHPAEVKFFAVFGFMFGESRISARPVNDGCAGFFCQVEVAGNKIGMKMGLKDILDFRTTFFRALQVWSCFPQRVNHGYFSIAFDVISALGEATGIDLFDFHVYEFQSSNTSIA